MTNKEFEEIIAEAREYTRRTSFPVLPGSDEDQEFSPHEHAEFGESHH